MEASYKAAHAEARETAGLATHFMKIYQSELDRYTREIAEAKHRLTPGPAVRGMMTPGGMLRLARAEMESLAAAAAKPRPQALGALREAEKKLCEAHQMIERMRGLIEQNAIDVSVTAMAQSASDIALSASNHLSVSIGFIEQARIAKATA